MPKKKASVRKTSKRAPAASSKAKRGRVFFVNFPLSTDDLRCSNCIVNLDDQGEAEALSKRLERLDRETLLVYCSSEDDVAANIVRGLVEYFGHSFYFPMDERECLCLILSPE